MLSPGSPSKWQTQDSLSSTSSLVYSESEQTEDESEVFSSESETAGVPPGANTHSLANGSTDSQTTALSVRIPTEGDLRFARKCSELRGYIRPLVELLNGLKTGRYERGLSSFQQSVAMDRLRRIVGVLQKPDLGEKYMGTLLQLEMMLKVWFPQVRPQHRNGSPSLHSLMANLPPRWNQDQLHIPVKKRRLSWSDSDSQGSSSSKRFHEDDRGPSPSDTSSWLSTSSELEDDSAICANKNEMTSETKLNAHLLIKDKTNPLNQTRRPPPLVIPPSATDGSILGTQDCSVSSTTPTSDPRADLISGNLNESVKREGPKKLVYSKCHRTETLST